MDWTNWVTLELHRAEPVGQPGTWTVSARFTRPVIEVRDCCRFFVALHGGRLAVSIGADDRACLCPGADGVGARARPARFPGCQVSSRRGPRSMAWQFECGPRPHAPGISAPWSGRGLSGRWQSGVVAESDASLPEQGPTLEARFTIAAADLGLPDIDCAPLLGAGDDRMVLTHRGHLILALLLREQLLNALGSTAAVAGGDGSNDPAGRSGGSLRPGQLRDRLQQRLSNLLEAPGASFGTVLQRVGLRPKALRGLTCTGLDLRCEDLSGLDLGNAVLPEARLRACSLRGGSLAESVLPDADLSLADLRDCCLAHADLAGSILRGARLNGADLTDADLSRADLTGADLSDADLTGARLDQAWMRRAVLSGIGPTGADLRRPHIPATATGPRAGPDDDDDGSSGPAPDSGRDVLEAAEQRLERALGELMQRAARLGIDDPVSACRAGGNRKGG